MIPNYLKRELDILFFIISKHHTSLVEISTSLSLSKRITKESIISINNYFDKPFIVSNNIGKITIHEDFENNTLAYVYELKLSRLKGQVIFNLCVLLVTRPKIKRKQILDHLFISSTYLSQLTKTLRKFFSSFDFTIKINDGCYSLEGNEMNIRLFSYLFLYDAYQDLDWPFSNIPMENIQEQVKKEMSDDWFKMSNTKTRSIYIIYAIIQTRISAGYYMSLPQSQNIKNMFTIISENFDISLIFQTDFLGNLTKKNKYNEILYFNFLIGIFVSNIIPKQKKIELGNIFSNFQHPYCFLAKKISHILENNKIILSEEDHYLAFYFITLLNTFYFLVGDTFTDFINLLIPKPSFYLTIKNSYFTNNISQLIEDPTHVELLCTLLYTFTTSYIQPQIKIYTQLSKDFISNYLVKNKLHKIFNSEIILITENYLIADIIITDTLERTNTTQKIFYLNSINNEENWSELITLVQQMYFEKEKAQINHLIQ